MDETDSLEQSFRSWAKSIQLDENAVNAVVRYGDGVLYDYVTVQSFYVEDPFGAGAAEQGFVYVGDCANGDQIAVDLAGEPGSVWIIDHERMHTFPLREVAVRIGANLYDTYHEWCDEDDFPRDFYSARDYFSA